MVSPECLRAVLPREVIVRWECGMFESLTVGSVKTYGPFKDCSVLLVKDGGVVVTIATQFAIAEYSQPVPQSQPQALANNTTTSPPLADSGDVFFDVWGSVRQGQGKLITSASMHLVSLSLMTSKTQHCVIRGHHKSTHFNGICASCLRERLAAIASSSSATPELDLTIKSSFPFDPLGLETPRCSPRRQKKKSLLDHDDSGEDQPSFFLCDICFDDKPVSDMFEEGKCNHLFCTHCMSKYVTTQIQQNILKVIMCPNANCSVELKPEYFHNILASEVIVRWETVMCESMIVELEKTYCPFKDCSVLLVNDGEKVVTSAECPSCHRLFCAQCKVPWHGSMSCEEFQEIERNKDEKVLENKFFKLAKEEKWQKCPRCTMFVQRREGCDHMTCRCGCDFCYICGKNWMLVHNCKKNPST
ncbi:E3 ubiquitin-protein ligase RNF144A [Glycine soja]